MTYHVYIRELEVMWITFDKKGNVINSSPYLMFLMGRPQCDVDAVLRKRGWTWTTSN